MDFVCREHVPERGREEPNPTHSIAFVRRGSFVRFDRDRAVHADPNVILFFNQAQPYGYAHPIAGGDECTILTLDTAAALAAVACREPRHAEGTETPFRFGYAASTPRAAHLHFALLTALHGNAPSLACEDLAVELIGESLRSAYSGVSAAKDTSSGAAARRRQDTVEAAKRVLSERFEAPPRLAELAALLGCSQFHLSRTFRRVTGMSLRGYLGRLRTRLAVDRLARGAPSLTELALDLGFADHSHFTNTFRREWGEPPSRVRACAGHGPSRAASCNAAGRAEEE